MKKLLAILLVLAMTLACTAALAERVRFVEESPDFDIEMELPEGAVAVDTKVDEMLSLQSFQMGELAPVSIVIAPSDIYETLSMNDLSDEDVEALKAIAGEQYDDPKATVDVTPSGNKYIHICANAEYDMDSIFTLYKGYFIQLTQWHEDYSEITDADYAFMQQLLYNIEFLPVTK